MDLVLKTKFKIFEKPSLRFSKKLVLSQKYFQCTYLEDANLENMAVHWYRRFCASLPRLKWFSWTNGPLGFIAEW